LEILGLVARHLTNAQIAEELCISTRTVESHVSALLRKLHLPDRRSLARRAEALLRLVVRSGRRYLPVSVTSFVGREAHASAPPGRPANKIHNLPLDIKALWDAFRQARRRSGYRGGLTSAVA
jgi:DNA-binding CsgD family transcriptional regulator